MKTFLSIGSGPGMGLATAERFAKEGFRIISSARNEGKTRELADRLRAKGYEVAVWKVDASDPASVASLVSEVEECFGAIDVLHYNAAAMRKATLAEQPLGTLVGDLAAKMGVLSVAAQVAAPPAGARRQCRRGGGFARQLCTPQR